MELITPNGAGAVFHITLTEGWLTSEGRRYPLPGERHADWLDLFEALARDLGLRAPLSRRSPPADEGAPALEPVLTEPVSPSILYGYGDPCVVEVAKGDYRLLVTSNDAPNAFPILASSDLKSWRHQGFVFPESSAPPWALTGAGISDFWAPELHRVGEAWWVCFTARAHDRSLSIGLARGASPDGPFEPDPAPLVGGGVIDSHILVDEASQPWLIWKQDDNDRWPRALMALLETRPELVGMLFEGQDARMAAFLLTLWPWTRSLEPMAQFFVLQTLIEAVGEDLDGFARRLEPIPGAGEILAALRTRIFAQRLSPDGRRLEGERKVILQNDLPWEGHLIEGVWITEEGGRYYLVYSGNDFSTALYGIGAAVADAPDGPYRKGPQAFLRSTRQWWGPGHPSIARDLEGRRRLFLHGFRPGEAAYGAFRALLTVPISLEGGAVRLRQ